MSIRESFEHCVEHNPEWSETEKDAARAALRERNWDRFEQLLKDKGYRLYIESSAARASLST